jgi:hypothetical protein
LFIKNDGTAWGCGYNANSELGTATAGGVNPVQVPALTGVAKVATGRYHTVFMKSDGTVWASGLNDKGQLGDGTKTKQTEVVQVPSLSGVTAVAAGYFHSIFLKNDGTIWVTGSNGYGQLGDGTDTNRAAPILINPCNTISSIAETSTNAARVSVFPNPASGRFTITNESSRIASLTIYSITGEKLISQQPDSNKAVIDLGGHASGVYFYQLQNSDQTISTGKVIID